MIICSYKYGLVVGNNNITRLTAATFQLGPAGIYQVFFQVSVTEAGQLQISLNGVAIANSVVGRNTGTSQIVGMSLIRTTSLNNVLSIINPLGNTPALTITPNAGGASAVSAHLVITLLSITAPPSPA